MLAAPGAGKARRQRRNAFGGWARLRGEKKFHFGGAPLRKILRVGALHVNPVQKLVGRAVQISGENPRAQVRFLERGDAGVVREGDEACELVRCQRTSVRKTRDVARYAREICHQHCIGALLGDGHPFVHVMSFAVTNRPNSALVTVRGKTAALQMLDEIDPRLVELHFCGAPQVVRFRRSSPVMPRHAASGRAQSSVLSSGFASCGRSRVPLTVQSLQVQGGRGGVWEQAFRSELKANVNSKILVLRLISFLAGGVSGADEFEDKREAAEIKVGGSHQDRSERE